MQTAHKVKKGSSNARDLRDLSVWLTCGAFLTAAGSALSDLHDALSVSAGTWW